MPSSKNCNWGGLINISSIVSFRPPRHFFLHFFWHFFVIIVIVWQINKYKYKYKYIFQRPFLRGLFLEGPVLGKAYVRREICVIKSVGLACSGNEIYHFCFVLLCTRGQILSTSPPRGLYSEGWFNGGFFALRFWGVYTWRGLYMEGLIFRILRHHFDRKGGNCEEELPFRLPSFDKIWYCPFHIPCLELCMIPF